MKIRTIIIDDKTANITTLSKLLTLYCPQIELCATAENITEGYNAIVALQPALVFLDIEMPDGSGFDLLSKFDNPGFAVIFTTAYNQYAIRAFRERALDYLLKPIVIDELRQAVSKASQQAGLQQKHADLEQHLQRLQAAQLGKISIPVLDGYLFINQQDIIRCEASRSYTHFFMADGRKLVVSLHLKECEGLLSHGPFFRVHHSHIINLQYIVRYTKGRGGYVQMTDNSIVEVAASKKEAFLELIKTGLRDRSA
ncbi:LytR/AlgR family response regulator transcription factor [Taibaiella chishuiensis]|uniref:LytTR family two component transcriptional regulator n=1 Tax=Taibaiella chishuiensis TaxID=1434707 RepID=A0A2P8D5F7_9BACT|nr:LytTR family DNA-binding domain-containing protein [Taibaiella chishuiensis]PSK92454.1 LytTR family two component transcriptional regulator [Taibaiella chishuiensis]